MTTQLSLFAVAEAYAEGELDNDALYRGLASRHTVDLESQAPIGRAGTRRSLGKRAIRWHQQTLKAMGVLERVPGRRAVWRLTRYGRAKLGLTEIHTGWAVVAFSTRLGVAVWGRCEEVFQRLDQPITLCVTSPPYPLREARAYGNPAEAEYVDFLCRALEPVVRSLRPGGTIALNLGNDCSLAGSPARSLYRERLVLALHDRLGLYKLDEIPWINRSKPPGPIAWASKQRMQLNVGWEPVYLFTNNPLQSLLDNRRVLEPHTERHQRFVAAGGDTRDTSSSDEAYRYRPGAYAAPTAGKIPKNVIERGHRCVDNDAYRAAARGMGLPVHGAMFPVALAEFLIRYGSAPDDLVVDPFGGSATTALAAERYDRRWMITEIMAEYLRGGAERFWRTAGIWINPLLERITRTSQRHNEAVA